MRNYFTIDGVDSRDFGVYISGQGTFRAPARSYNMISVPGRDGDLVGIDNRLENGELTYPAFICTNFSDNVAALRAWLLSLIGYHRLVDSYHPDEYRMVLFRGPFDPDVTPTNGAGKFDITFVCMPQRFLFSGEEITTLDAADPPTDTYTGPVSSFEAAAGDSLRSVVCAVNPVQDLHGYDNPWPAGGGKNLLDTQTASTQTASNHGLDWTLSNNVFSVSGTASQNYCSLSLSSLGLPSMTLPAGTYRLYVFDLTGNFPPRLTTPTFSKYITRDQSTTLTEETTFSILVSSALGAGTQVEGSFKLMVVDTSTGVPTVWQPYSNECPISGFTGLTAYRTGKNLLDKSTTSGTSTLWFAEPNGILFRAGTTYCLSIGTAGDIASLAIYATDKTTQLAYISNSSVKELTFTPSSDVYGLPQMYKSGGVPQTAIDSAMLEIGITRSEYASYSGNAYPVTWQSEAGTVYGGTPDVLTGVLTVDRAIISKKYSELTPVTETPPAGFSVLSFGQLPSTGTGDYGKRASTLCNLCSYNDNGSNPNVIRMTSSGRYLYLTLPIGLDPDTEVTAVYPLATPLTYQLAPTAITALLGENNVWHDANGDTTVVLQHQFSIDNPTRFDSQPLLRVYGSGVLGIGTQSVTITGADVYTDIDCAMMDAHKGAVNKNNTVQLSGYRFPVLTPGKNYFALGTGITKVEITPRWWTV